MSLRFRWGLIDSDRLPSVHVVSKFHMQELHYETLVKTVALKNNEEDFTKETVTST